MFEFEISNLYIEIQKSPNAEKNICSTDYSNQTINTQTVLHKGCYCHLIVVESKDTNTLSYYL